MDRWLPMEPNAPPLVEVNWPSVVFTWFPLASKRAVVSNDAVSGAIMVIGLRYGRTKVDDVASKEKTYAVVTEFLREFKRRNNSVTCTGLLGYNLSDPSQVAEVKKKNVVMSRCPIFVREAVELVVKLV